MYKAPSCLIISPLVWVQMKYCTFSNIKHVLNEPTWAVLLNYSRFPVWFTPQCEALINNKSCAVFFLGVLISAAFSPCLAFSAKDGGGAPGKGGAAEEHGASAERKRWASGGERQNSTRVWAGERKHCPAEERSAGQSRGFFILSLIK